MAEFKKRPIFVSPKGIARYPKLTQPDTKFDAKGVYSVDLVLPADSEDAKKFIAQYDKAFNENFAAMQKEKGKAKVKPASKPYSDLLTDDKDDPQPTGDIKIRFKLPATGVAKNKDGSERAWSQRPALFDAKRNALKPEDLKIGGGSVIRVAYEMFPWWTAKEGAGVSLRMKSVQIIELKEFGARSAADFGFEEEEGFSASDTTETPGETPERSDSDRPADDGSGDF